MREHSFPDSKVIPSDRIINKYTYMHDYKISRHPRRDSLNLGGRED